METPTRPYLAPDAPTKADLYADDDFVWPLWDETMPEIAETTYEAWMESRSDDRYEVQPDARDPRTS